MNNTLHYLGYSNLAIILEQERKHWLLKTDKKKTSIDVSTGDMFVGQIDNMGSEILLESYKTPEKVNNLQNISFINDNLNEVFQAENGSFPFSTSVSGLLIERILSSQILFNGTRSHYKLKLKNCEEVIIPFSTSDYSEKEVLATHWLKSTTLPSVMLFDDSNHFTTEINLEFVTDVTNPTWYYPLDETLQPLPISESDSINHTYETSIVDSDAYIGYPLYWFTCDQYSTGPSLSTSLSYKFCVGNPIVSSLKNASVYPINITSASDTVIQVNSLNGDFDNNESDFYKELSRTFHLVNTSTNDTQEITFSDPDIISSFIMNKNDINWTYVDSSTYEISLSEFESNNDNDTPLISSMSITFDDSWVNKNKTTDYGYAGISIASGNWNDTMDRYPYELNTFEGLPEWLNQDSTGDEVPQHVAIYAIHNTPDSYTAQSKQIAAIILDPGKIKNEDNDDELTSEQRGRVYIISNDDIKYENNAKAEYPKPARTAARICDIPTSVVELISIQGIAPTVVVDKDYVRSECSYTYDDKYRLHNILSQKWVTPKAENSLGIRIIDSEESEDSLYIFKSIDSLKKVDLVQHNDFRYKVNLNPQIPSLNVELGSIMERGSLYQIDDIGVIIVGGFAFNYIVTEVDDNGGVLDLIITPSDEERSINLSNFNMDESMSGVTGTYGTSPVSSDSESTNGTGLKIKFNIKDFRELIKDEGEIFEDLFALVAEKDGLYMYQYDILESDTNIPKLGFWNKGVKISEYEESNINMKDGSLSVSDSYINSIIPSTHELPISLYEDGKEQVFIQAIVTSSFINITDTKYTPIQNLKDTRFTVDMCKFHTDGLRYTYPKTRTTKDVLNALKSTNELSYDSFVLWRFENYADPNNLKLEYMIIRRSFNNFVSSDSVSLLPENELRYDKFVHTNQGTIVTWNVDNVGQMVWVYVPDSHIHEKYSLNENGDLHIDREPLRWDTIDVRDTNTGERIEIVGEDGRLKFNIATNNPQILNYDPDESDVIYQQPEYESPGTIGSPIWDLAIGSNVSNINPSHQPIGNWSLVYPRVKTFKLTSMSDNRNIDVLPLNCIRTSNISENAVISDMYGVNVNNKSVVIDKSSDGISLKIFDADTKKWKNI